MSTCSCCAVYDMYDEKTVTSPGHRKSKECSLLMSALLVMDWWSLLLRDMLPRTVTLAHIDPFIHTMTGMGRSNQSPVIIM